VGETVAVEAGICRSRKRGFVRRKESSNVYQRVREIFAKKAYVGAKRATGVLAKSDHEGTTVPSLGDSPERRGASGRRERKALLLSGWESDRDHVEGPPSRPTVKKNRQGGAR